MTTNTGMRELLAVINKLQDAFSVSGLSLGALDLPQIAVVGGQSAGKSSVLENFVGRDFLPRGSGIVTRRPLVLQLHPSKEEYAEFLHKPDEKFRDFDAVRKEIEEETDRITGKNKGISDVPINLRIYSPHVLDLTLVDLPGITKIPVGDQPQDIEHQIRNMILRFISLENTLILAVSPANSDLANSDALKLAKEVDPEGKRTIGVITKLDLMDQGTDARDILENKVFPLSRGYVGLVNRSQRDIDSRKDIWAAQEAEMEFFKNHAAYSHMMHLMGSKYLQEILNQQLHEHIKEKLPYLRSTVKQQHKKTHDQLAEMNAFDESSEGWRQKLFIKLVNEFADEIKTSILGNDVKVENSDLSAGAKINICFYSSMANLLSSTGNLSEDELAVIIKNLHGIGNTLFTPEMAFDVAVRKLVEKYINPILQCVDLVSDILVQCINNSSRHFQDYPRLKDEVLVLVNDKIKHYEERTKKHLKIHIKAQMAFMNTKHQDFHRVASLQQIPKDFKGLKDGNMNIAEPPTQIPRSNSIESIAPSGYSDSVDSGSMVSRSTGYTTVSTPPYNIASRPPGTASYPVPASPQVANGSVQKTYEIMNKGWMLYHPTGIGRKTKQYWFILHSYAVSWYKDDTEREMIGSFSLDNVKLIKKESPGKKYNRLILSREGKPKDSSKLELSCRNDHEEAVWVTYFEKSGIIVESSSDLIDEDRSQYSSTENLPKNRKMDFKTKQLIEGDPELRGERDLILYMLHSYMNIVHKTILDIVPKYVVLLLVKETLEYTSKHMLGELMYKEDWDHFLETSTEETKKKNELFKIYEATKKAIDIMNEVSQDL